MAPSATDPPDKGVRGNSFTERMAAAQARAKAAKKPPATKSTTPAKKAAANKEAPAKKPEPGAKKAAATKDSTPTKETAAPQTTTSVPPVKAPRKRGPARSGAAPSSQLASQQKEAQAPRTPAPPPATAPRSGAQHATLAANIPYLRGGTVSWFLYGIGRQPTGAFVALLAGYTALIVSLWYAVLGMIFGVLVAIHAIHANSVTQDLFNAGAGTSVTAVAVATGALVGAGGGFVSFYTHTLASSPLQEGVGIVFGFLLSVAVVAVIAVFEGNLLALRGCRQLTVDEVQNLADAPEPRHPVRPSQCPPICDKANKRHERMGTHASHRAYEGNSRPRRQSTYGSHRPRAAPLAFGRLGWPTRCLGVRLARSPAVQHRVSLLQRRAWCRNPADESTWIYSLRRLVNRVAAWLLVKFPITLAVRRDMRAQEYEADAAIKQIGYGPALISALRTLSIFEGGRTGWETALYATHPTSDERIDRLQVRTAADMDHVEPPLGAETNSLVGLIWGLAIVFAAFIAWGAVLNANRLTLLLQPRTPQHHQLHKVPLLPNNADAERSAASFSLRISTPCSVSLDINKSSVSTVIPDAPHVLSYQADAGNPGVISTWAAGQPTASKAQVVACGFESGTSANTAIAEVFVHWTFSVGGSSGSQWVDDAVPLTLVDSRWLADDLPTIPDISSGGYASTIQPEPPTPSGYGQCP